MMRSVLDTDILSEVFKRKDQRVIERASRYLAAHGKLTTTAITVMEVVSGWHRLQREDHVQQFIAALEGIDVLELTSEAAIAAGRIDADLRRTGQEIGRADAMVAAIAVTAGFPLVTGNTAHYERIRALGHDLALENWRL